MKIEIYNLHGAEAYLQYINTLEYLGGEEKRASADLCCADKNSDNGEKNGNWRYE